MQISLLITLALGLVAPVAPVAPPALSAQARAETQQQGLAAFYARRRHGWRTASGERFDNAALVAAHPSLPFGTRVRVTNLENGRAVEVRVIDRGPSAAQRRKGYVIDVSRAAANALGFVKAGRARVRVEVI